MGVLGMSTGSTKEPLKYEAGPDEGAGSCRMMIAVDGDSENRCVCPQPYVYFLLQQCGPADLLAVLQLLGNCQRMVVDGVDVSSRKSYQIKMESDKQASERARGKGAEASVVV